jgi:hypothetical protein
MSINDEINYYDRLYAREQLFAFAATPSPAIHQGCGTLQCS